MVFTYYYYELKDENDDIILFNCATNRIVKIKHQYVEPYERIKCGTISLASDLERFLYNEQFIVSSHESEVLNINRKFDEFTSSRKRLRLTILPTNSCNFNCRYCCQSAPYSTMDIQTQRNVLKYILTKLKSYKSLYISWFGGEPLMAADIIHSMSQAIILECKKERKPYLAEITTNGYLLSLEVFEKMLNDRVYFYQVTLDGEKNIHNRNRPHKTDPDSFSKVYSNLLA